MADFVFLFRGGALQQDDVSPEEMQQHMQKWQRWIQQMTERGIYRGGQPLHGGGRTVAPGGLVSDGPFPETKEMVAGYMAIDVASLEEAVAVARDCPIFEYDGRVEVRQVLAEKSAEVHEGIGEIREGVAVS